MTTRPQALTLPRFVRLGTDGYQYRPEVVEVYDDPDTCPEPLITVIEVGPALGNALLPADVRAARWAVTRHLPYRG